MPNPRNSAPKDRQSKADSIARAALEEARQRRLKAAKEERPGEVGGPKGPEPTRHGDWERNGIASDF